MKYVFVVEGIATGRYYVREAVERGCTPVVLFPRMTAEAEQYAPFRASRPVSVVLRFFALRHAAHAAVARYHFFDVGCEAFAGGRSLGE